MQPENDNHAASAALLEPLRIGDWLLVPSTHTLSREGAEHRLPRRLVDLLVCLCSRPGETFSREALLEAVWARKVVSDEVLSRAVAELRGLLGDDARSPRYIETLPKTGYRLVAPVSRPAPSTIAAPGESEAQGSSAVTPDSRRTARPPSRWLPWAGAALLGLAIWAIWPERNEAPSAGAETTRSAGVAGQGWTAADLVREHPFRSGPYWAWQPRYSQDGRWLAYAVNDLVTGETWLEWSSADGSAPRRLDGGPGRLAAPVFSPDGTRLAFTAWVEGRCSLRVVELPAGLPRELAQCGGSRSHPLDWPKADRLLYSGPPGAPGEAGAIWSIDPGSGRAAPLTAPPDVAVFDSHPRQRGDGTLAFLRGPEGLRELWLRDAAGVERRLLPGAHRIPDLSWTATGDALIVASDRDGFPGLQWLDPESGELRLLGARGAATLAVSPDGSLLYERRRYDANLWRYGNGEPERLTDSTRYEAFASLSPDGEALVYVSNRDGNGSLWWQREDAEHRLPLPAAETWVRPRWLTADQLLVTRYAAGGETFVEVYDLGSQRLLDAHPLSGPGFAAVAVDEGRILFGEGHGRSEGMQLRLRSDEGEQAVPAATQVAEFDTDGRWIIWETRGDARWHLLPVADPGAEVLSLDMPEDLAAWCLHQGQIVYVAYDGQRWALWRQAVGGGPAERWLDLRNAPTDGRVVVGPDGRGAIVSHIDDFSADLMRVPPRS